MQLCFFLNGEEVCVQNPRPEMTLLQFLRQHHCVKNGTNLKGTKLGCAEGGCGACTVMVSSYDHTTDKITHCSVNACLAPLCSVQDCHVISVEGVGNSANPHPIQERFAKMFASQCGFCTPGFVMSLYALLRNNPNPTERDIEECFDGNLCRCTGYRPILDAAKSFCSADVIGCNKGSGCCKVITSNVQLESDSYAEKLVEFVPLKRYDPSQELIFPPVLLNRLRQQTSQPRQYLVFSSDLATWHRPKSFEHLLELKQQFGSQLKLIGGNSEVGIEVKFKNMKYPHLAYPMDIPELKTIIITDNGVSFGACVTLSKLRETLRNLIDRFPEESVRTFKAIYEMLKWFAGNQIRNVATIAGNIATASPISDLNPILMACNATLTLVECGDESRTLFIRDFFLGYRKTALKETEIIYSVFIPFTRSNEYIYAFKQSKRKDDDISIVTTGMQIVLKENKNFHEIVDCCFAFGGMGATTLQAKYAQQYCRGKLFDRHILENVYNNLINHDFPLSLSAPGGFVEYRRSLVMSLFFKFFLKVSSHLGHKISEDSRSIISDEETHRPVSCSSHFALETSGVVGRSVQHTSALKQATGEAVYVDDTLKFANELYAGLVLSSKAHAHIKSIDFSDCLKMEGVRGVITHRDIPPNGSNIVGPVFKDEELFAKDEVHFCGQLIALVIAEDQAIAQRAAKTVRVEYEILDHILTIEEAIEKQSFFPVVKQISKGKVDEAFLQCQHLIEGEIRVGGQNHFYFETQASIVIPKSEDDEIEILSSTQNPTETQHLVSYVLGVSSNKVVCKVKRLGGGFGGKETRPAILSCALAVAAKKFKVPIRCMLDRDEDMIMCGQRHPFLGRYKIGFANSGQIIAADIQLFSNGGYSADLSIGVMERAVTHTDNCYFVPNMRVTGKVCKTNIHSNTAFRGFGGPQGMFVTETWMTHVAEFLRKPVETIRTLNLYRQGQTTHFNQQIEHFYVDKMWLEIVEKSNYSERRIAVEQFNRCNKWKKRGLAILPTKFGIAFTARFLNQAGALVHIYTDGSVLLSHGGTEMGQGLHTKMIQICADALRIPTEFIHISDTSTDKVPNTSPTAASASSDLNGMAVLDACSQLMARLKPYFNDHPALSFKEVVTMAYRDRVNLCANGFYKTPDIEYDWDKNSGRLFNYFTYGVAVSEVELDILTGSFQTLRSDILMDLGKSLNPAIDIGQIEGAFVQGIGWCTMEETLFFRNGQLFTKGPGNYKIPSSSDIPIDMRVSLFSESTNPRAIHSSKAVGEPPLFLGASVYFALRDAIKYQREESGANGFFRLDSPATCERLRMACLDELSSLSRSIKLEPNEQDWCVRV